MTDRRTQLFLLGAAVALAGVTTSAAQTGEPAQMKGIGAWTEAPVFTIGEEIDGYIPPGVPDGMGAFDRGDGVQIVVNHELRASQSYPYRLANGAELRGARVSSFMVDKVTRELIGGGLAYGVIYNRAGLEVSDAVPLDSSDPRGLNRLCSAAYYAAGENGFVDDIFLTGEETGGGTEFALDVDARALHAAPWMGAAAWESVAALEMGRLNDDYVAILVGDDREAAPLLLYVGEKRPGGFLERNGLARGRLYVWVADNGDTTPEEWNGTWTGRTGRFVEIDHYRPDLAGGGDYDDLGFATQTWQDALARAAGAFQFSRPEDVHTNPRGGTQAVLASTGRGGRFPSDNWGTTYIVDVKINRGRIKNGNIRADLRIIYDGDDAGAGQFAGPDYGLRSPDNLVWADDGYIYIQEDRSTSPSRLFGGTIGEEASMWQLDPRWGRLVRVARVDRLAVPSNQVDVDPNDLGDWETSGVIDVTGLFEAEDERLLLFNVQAHSLRGGPIGAENLVQGGQLLFLSAEEDGRRD